MDGGGCLTPHLACKGWAGEVRNYPWKVAAFSIPLLRLTHSRLVPAKSNGANAFSIGATGKSYRCIVPKRMCLQTSMPPSVTCEYARCSSRVQLLPAAQEEAEGEENSRGSLFFHSAFFASFKHLPLTLGIPGHCCCDWNHCRLDLQNHHPEIVGLASHPVPLQSAPYE